MRARRRAPAAALLLMTTPTRAASRPLAQASSTACRVVPSPEANTAILMAVPVSLNSVTKLPYLTAPMLGIDLDKADHGHHSDLRIAPHGTRGLSQLVLRTDIAGMPLEWIDYREAAQIYHQDQVAYTCGSTL